jgi:hypothetical protein
MTPPDTPFVNELAVRDVSRDPHGNEIVIANLTAHPSYYIYNIWDG